MRGHASARPDQARAADAARRACSTPDGGRGRARSPATARSASPAGWPTAAASRCFEVSSEYAEIARAQPRARGLGDRVDDRARPGAASSASRDLDGSTSPTSTPTRPATPPTTRRWSRACAPGGAARARQHAARRPRARPARPSAARSSPRSTSGSPPTSASSPSCSASRDGVTIARTPRRWLDLALEDLARRALRELVGEPDPARVLVGGDALA